MFNPPQDSSQWLLKDFTIIQWEPPSVERGDLRIKDGWITETGPNLTAQPNEKVMEGKGAWLIPGLVCGHTHLYSALSCGMPMPASAPISFGDMLDKVWWRLDRALDKESVIVSGLVGGIAALRVGVTTVIDHHASPNAIEESLLSLDDALGDVGLRRVLCYEVTDRGGEERANAGLKAHEELLSRPVGKSSDGQRAVMIGAHANFTLSDETLRRCAELSKHAGVGLHIHVAEAMDDAILINENPVLRLDRLGALQPGSILAHCVHTSSDDLKRIHDAGCWVTHQPRSNMNNSVGYAPVQNFSSQTFLGTDGIGADMLTELQTAWYQGQEAKLGWSPQQWLSFFHNASNFASQQLGVPLGELKPGSVADLVWLDPPPGPPLTASNLAAAVIFRFSPHQIRHVMVGGSWKLWNQVPLSVDSAELQLRAESVATDIWRRMDSLS